MNIDRLTALIESVSALQVAATLPELPSGSPRWYWNSRLHRPALPLPRGYVHLAWADRYMTYFGCSRLDSQRLFHPNGDHDLPPGMTCAQWIEHASKIRDEWIAKVALVEADWHTTHNKWG